MAIEKSKNPAQFLEFERTGWGHSIVGYDDAFGVVTRLTVEPTLDAANVRSGMRVLDVCCGPGMLAEGAIARGAQAIGLDFSKVIELARNVVPRRSSNRAMRRTCRSPIIGSTQPCAVTA